ncbi:polysaccharide biosynthesis tyrosine autokinase [Desulfonatronovibrio hydrogenovorans]|uniref:polysaccharide biosynthesis tyrosine autokinase n=1 Tax=Desulfonatronovibrio hydrogenovorans TaxID=53245 RepID=UPI0004915A50|nr:polysaccharide biosynthesis tyrosine autokinase [Desulfonatronovibrio hydrogenovorans]
MSKIFEALQRAEQENVLPRSEKFSSVENVDVTGDLSEKLVVVNRPGSVAAEQFRFLRSQIVRPIEGSAPKTILITSSLQGEGKTFTACNLAVTIAQGMDEYVLLVDADLRSPRVHSFFGYDRAEKGLATHLEYNEPLPSLFKKTAISKLTILPAGQETDNPSELLSSQKMHSFISEVRDRYPDRLIIFDSPPVNLAPETMVIAKEVDAIFVVLLRGKTPRHIVKSTLERFQKEKVKGVIFNQDPDIAKTKYYSYGYGYGSGKSA